MMQAISPAAQVAELLRRWLILFDTVRDIWSPLCVIIVNSGLLC